MAMAGTGAQDPTYLAYLRALGLQEDAARANAARQSSAIMRQVATTTPEIARLGMIQRRNIGNSFEARGVYGSGTRMKRQAEQRAGESYRVGQTFQRGADQGAAIQSNLQLTLADLARQRAERAALYGVGA